MTDSGPIPPESSPASTPAAASPASPVNAPAPAGTNYIGPAPTAEDKQMGMLAHLLGILGFVGPLIIWLIKKDTSPFVNDQGKEALNFHLMLLIGIVIGGATVCLGIGLVIIPAVWILGIVFSILGAMKAKDGIAYRYPFTIRFIK
jgi:hypothetical protein